MDFCVVTGFFYIGRDKWSSYERSLDDYLLSFLNMLKLKTDMVIFTENRWVQFVRQIRYRIPYVTRIIEKELCDLEMYKYLPSIFKIQKDSEYLSSHPNPRAPEICQPLYNVVVCSKMDLVYQASRILDYKYYVWMDAGFSHNSIDLSSVDWVPRTMFQENKVSFLLIDKLEKASKNPKTFFNQYIDVVIGNCFCVHKNVVENVREKYYTLIEELFLDKIKDDDQYYNTVFCQRYPFLIHVDYEYWYYNIINFGAKPTISAVSLLWRGEKDTPLLLETIDKIPNDFRVWVSLHGDVSKELYMSLLQKKVWFRIVPKEYTLEKAKLSRVDQLFNKSLKILVLQDPDFPFDENKVRQSSDFKVIQKETLIINCAKVKLNEEQIYKILDTKEDDWLLYLQGIFQTTF